MPDSSVESLAQLYTRPGFLLRRAHQISVAIFEDSFAGLDLSPQQYAVMVALRDIPNASQNDIARALGMNKVTASQVVQGLEDRGWLRRETAADDRRHRKLVLTTAGKRALARSLSMADAAYEDLLVSFSARERDTLIALLQRIVVSLEDRARTPFVPVGEGNRASMN